MINLLDTISAEGRKLLDALQIFLGLAYGHDHEEVRRSLRAAGMTLHRASDGCESWRWPGRASLGPCRHGFAYDAESLS